MKRRLVPLLCLLGSGCVTGADFEDAPAAETAPPMLLRLHGALSEAVEPWALVWVTSRGEGCKWEEERLARQYTGPASLASTEGTGDIVARATREGTNYVLEIPWRWSTPAGCTYEASSVGVHVDEPSRVTTSDIGGSALRIVSHRMPSSTDVAALGSLSCRQDPFASGGLTCRRASGLHEPGADPETGISFFAHVDEPDASSSDPSTIDVPLAILERRASCQAMACDAGCAPGQADCLVSDCDPARDCAASLSSFRQDQPVAIAGHGALVSRSELVVAGEGAAPARLADLVVQLDYIATDDIALYLTRGDVRTSLFGIGGAPRFGDPGRGEYHFPLDPRVAADPAGTWTLEIEQRRPFFNGAVISWGLDLYR